jgi:hypothetical protein
MPCGHTKNSLSRLAGRPWSLAKLPLKSLSSQGASSSGFYVRTTVRERNTKATFSKRLRVTVTTKTSELEQYNSNPAFGECSAGEIRGDHTVWIVNI